MSDALTDLLETRPWLLLDGATGTNLFAMGLEAGEAPELWNLDAPDKVVRLHEGFVAAGSDVILTNSFGGTAYRLRLHGAEAQVAEINAAAARIARSVADGAGRPVIVAGSVGPTGEILAPVGSLSHDEAVAAFRAQIAGLMDGGADVIWTETLSSEEEFRAVAEAADAEGAPLAGTLSFDTAGRTMMGITSGRFAALAAATPGLVAYGANCGVGASDLLRTVLGISADAPDGAPIVAKGNAGIPKYVDGHIHYDGTPELMADYAVLARDAGARLIGGCCGTQPDHLVAMRAALESRAPGERPSLETIAARIGPFSSKTDGNTGGPPPERPRRRRRG